MGSRVKELPASAGGPGGRRGAPSEGGPPIPPPRPQGLGFKKPKRNTGGGGKAVCCACESAVITQLPQARFPVTVLR